jgi:hypothetical protein
LVIDRMNHCLSSVFFDDRDKRSSWLGWALGDGQQLDSISVSLKETITAYNTNFHNLEQLDSTIVVRYNEITSKMESLSEHEHLLRDLLIAVQIETQLQLKRQIYLKLKSQHLTAIREIIEKSDLHESIDLISRSIFHRNFCSVDACETDIYSQSSGNKIIVHRELLLLEPSQDLHIQCKAASPSHVSIFYNQVGQRVGVNTIILDSKIINENSLKNSSFVTKI